MKGKTLFATIATFITALVITLWLSSANAAERPTGLQTRCGWFQNPTPANAWLLDRDGRWIIGLQGGYQARGNWPRFEDSQWVKTNIHYGYGCACMRVTVRPKARQIVSIASTYAKPLNDCRTDPALKEPG